jgi:hypothetical protein
MTTWWLRTLAITGLMAVSCGSAHPVATIPSSASASPTTIASSAPVQNSCAAVQPAPRFPASAPSSRNLALVTLLGDNKLVVRDITDIHRPSTVGTVEVSSSPKFVNASEVSYEDQSGKLVRFVIGGSSRTIVAACASLFDWSRDGTSVVYLTQTDSGMDDLHQINAGDDRVLGSVPASGAGGCETIEGCAIANSVDFRLSYSPDGAAISLVSSGFGKSVFRILSSDGKPLKSSDSLGATMSAWSGTGLYFRDAGGVQVWRAGAISSFLPGVAWIRPKASPAGGKIVYVARDNLGWAHTYVVDTTTAIVRELKIGRAEPVFLTSRYVWYQGERECVPADGCGPTPPFHPLSGKTYIYDLQDGTETESLITGVSDVWPHAA